MTSPRLTLRDSVQSWVDKINAALDLNNVDALVHCLHLGTLLRLM